MDCPTAYQSLYMTLAVNITDGRGLIDKVHCWLLPKKSKVMLYLPFISQYKAFNHLYISNKMKRFSAFNSSKSRLLVGPVDQSYDQSVYVCSFITVNGTIYSNPGILTVTGELETF